MLPLVSLEAALTDLASRRPVFHSEADFQHALAWKLHQREPLAQVRLEYRPFTAERVYLDVMVRAVREPAETVALELKYRTRKLSATVAGERFELRDQAAQDISRYDAIYDIVRLERVVQQGEVDRAYAIWLTNDSAYWKPPTKSDAVDAEFRVHEGRTVSGVLSWSPAASVGTTRGRSEPLRLRGAYPVAWKTYSTVTVERYGSFRYAVVAVGPSRGGEGDKSRTTVA